VTDIWCFTCSHELKRELLTGRCVHLDPDDLRGCVCDEIGEDCQP
jgi:hypothetical protein